MLVWACTLLVLSLSSNPDSFWHTPLQAEPVPRGVCTDQRPITFTLKIKALSPLCAKNSLEHFGTSRTRHSERLRFATTAEIGLRTQFRGRSAQAIRSGRWEKMAAVRHEAAGKENKPKVPDSILFSAGRK